MKIAVASSDKDKNSNVSEKAGRAPYYLIFDETLKIVENIDNPFSFGGGGAGFSVAKMLADKKVDIVVASRFGSNMVGALEDKGLKYYEMNGKVEDVVSEVLNQYTSNKKSWKDHNHNSLINIAKVAIH